MLGIFTINTSSTEIKIASNHKDEVVATYLAEAGIEQVLFWFNNPDNYSDTWNFRNGYGDRPERFFRKRQFDSSDIPYFNTNGINQFNGTQETPDLEYISSISTDDIFLNDPISNIRSIQNSGKINIIRLYKSQTPTGICMVESIGITRSGIKRRMTVELITNPIPSLSSVIQIGSEGKWDGELIRAHWGDVRITGDANLGNSNRIPIKDPVAPVDGSSYQDDIRPIDQWIDIFTAGKVIYTDTPLTPPANVHPNQGEDINPDIWDYNIMKRYAIEHGRYYSTDTSGRLYLNGVMDDSTLGRDINKVIAENKGFVFIDTIDKKNPTVDNLAELAIEGEYMEGIFYINAKIFINMSGGTDISVKSPPPEDKIDEDARLPVILSGININGVIYSTGSITFKNETKIFGSVYSKHGIIGAEQMEIWYNHNLKTGYIKNIPAVLIAKGSWYED